MLNKYPLYRAKDVTCVLSGIFSMLEVNDLQNLMVVNRCFFRAVSQQFLKGNEGNYDIIINFKLFNESKSIFKNRYFMVVEKNSAFSSESMGEKSYFVTNYESLNSKITEFFSVTDKLADKTIDYEKLKLCQNFERFKKTDFPLKFYIFHNFESSQIINYDFSLFDFNDDINVFKFSQSVITLKNIIGLTNPFSEVRRTSIFLTSTVPIEVSQRSLKLLPQLTSVLELNEEFARQI